MFWWFLIPVLVIPALVACGGGGDDDDDDDDVSSQGPGGSSGSNTSGGSNVKLPDIKAATYGSGKVHIEISGDKDEKIDLDGGGIAQDGFAIFTYGNNADAGVQISFSNESKDEPGGVFLTTKKVATGGPWGKDCKVSLEQSDGKAKGEFSCDTIDALEPGTAKTFRVKLKGTFTAGP